MTTTFKKGQIIQLKNQAPKIPMLKEDLNENTVFVRFCISSNTDTFSTTADYKACGERIELTHIDMPVEPSTERCRNHYECIVFCDVLDDIKRRHPEADIKLIVADCSEEDISVQNDSIAIVTREQLMACDGICPQLGLAKFVANGFDGIQPIDELIKRLSETNKSHNS